MPSIFLYNIEVINMTVLFRFHKAGYQDSMDTQSTVVDMEDLLATVNREYDGIPPIMLLVVKPYSGIDERNGWDTYIVTAPVYGVVGFTNGPL